MRPINRNTGGSTCIWDEFQATIAISRVRGFDDSNAAEVEGILRRIAR